MNSLRILFVAIAAGFVSSCCTTPKRNDAFTEVGKVFSEAFGPLYEISILSGGAIDLFYSSVSLRHKNARWPHDYTELSAFVEGSDGYLVLGDYERVYLKPLPNDDLEVRYIRLGRTNEMKFTLGKPAKE